MDLETKDVAGLLGVSEETVQKWVVEEKIPAYLINQQYRFSRFEIENWMLNGSLSFNAAESDASHLHAKLQHSGLQNFSLYRAIHKGEVITDLSGESKEEIIKETMDRMAPKLGFDASVMTELLLDREELMPTALNRGIAVPHTRDFLLQNPFDVVIVVYPQRPIEYGALDKQPVHTLFFLLSTSDKKHLHLLAKIAHLSSQEGALELLRCRPGKDLLLDFIRDWEAQIASQNP